MDLVIALALGYLLGSIPSGLWLGKLVRGVDVRQYGSGKTGATNTLRVLGIRWAWLVVAMDVGKGAAAMAIAQSLGDSQGPEMAAALAAVAGHNWPVFARFRGGRGVLTGLGVLLVMEPLIAAAGLGVTILVVALTRYVSVGSILGILTAMLYVTVAGILGQTSLYTTTTVLSGGIFIVVRHWDNMLRLVKGTELRLGRSPGAAVAPRSRAPEVPGRQ
jgi:glycerol-3-phosphate acyltransferase PlsY